MLEKNIWIEENENKKFCLPASDTNIPLRPCRLSFEIGWHNLIWKGGGLVSTFQVQDVQIRFSSATYLTNRRSVVFMKIYTVTSIHCEIKALISYYWYMKLHIYKSDCISITCCLPFIEWRYTRDSLIVLYIRQWYVILCSSPKTELQNKQKKHVLDHIHDFIFSLWWVTLLCMPYESG